MSEISFLLPILQEISLTVCERSPLTPAFCQLKQRWPPAGLCSVLPTVPAVFSDLLSEKPESLLLIITGRAWSQKPGRSSLKKEWSESYFFDTRRRLWTGGGRSVPQADIPSSLFPVCMQLWSQEYLPNRFTPLLLFFVNYTLTNRLYLIVWIV